jgi:hypothetical protein
MKENLSPHLLVGNEIPIDGEAVARLVKERLHLTMEEDD